MRLVLQLVRMISNQRTKGFPEWELEQRRGKTRMSKNEVKQGVLRRLLHGAMEITKWGKSIMSGKV